VLSLIFGSIIIVYSIINLGRSFSPLVTPRKNNSIVTTGLYQYMRHPLYVGLIMLAFGLSAVFYDESRLMLSSLLALILNYKAKKEEEAMLAKHGDEYQTYMNEVSRFVPTF
jgi:protein-S-isoprenylcysteine O-methyltransferase Ste14